VHKLDPHTLFSIFEQGDEEVYKENDVEDLLDNPFVLIGMVVTGVENFYMIDKMYTLRHEEEYGRVRDKIKLKYFTKLCGYLDRVTPIEMRVAYSIGTDFELDRAIAAMNEILFFFENIELYEKCAKIKQYTDLLLNKKLQTLI
jgi:hypothetical protein